MDIPQAEAYPGRASISAFDSPRATVLSGDAASASFTTGRAIRRLTLQRIRQRRSPAIPLQLAAWSGAAAVVWLWWHDLRSVSGSTNGVLDAGRLAGLLAGYAMALVVLQMARVPALERRVGSDRVSRWHAKSGRYALTLILTHVFLTMWGFARQAGKPLTDIVQETVATVNNMPDMGMAAIGMSLLVVSGPSVIINYPN